MERPALYFPYIHVRDDDWLKAAALYWPSVRRLVPHKHTTHDSPTAQLFAQAGVLRDEEPRTLLGPGGDLMRTLEANIDRLAPQFQIDAYDGPSHADHQSNRGLADYADDRLGWIHVSKFPYHLIEALEERRLAVLGRDVSHGHGDPGNWIGLHPAVAGAYMTTLAGHLAERSRFEAITDQAELRRAVPNADFRSALQLLAGDQREVKSSDGVERYVMLTIEAVLPQSLGDVPVETILECREDLVEELTVFRNYVAAQASDLAELGSIPTRERRLDAFTEHVRSTIEAPLRSLETSLALHNIPTAKSFLTTGLPVPVTAAAALKLLSDQPEVSVAGSVAAAVGTAWWNVHDERHQRRRQSPVGYLLDVRNRLTPKTFVSRVRKLYTGTY
jgi:hypothetical protein